MTETKVADNLEFRKPADKAPTKKECSFQQLQSVQLVGGGRWSQVFEAYDATTGQTVAIKLESKESARRRMADHEFLVYSCIHGSSGMYGFPRLVDKGKDLASGRQYLMLQRLGQPLSRLAPMTSLLHLYRAASQMIERVLALHDEGIVHRDLTPDNFLLGHHDDQSPNTLFLIDFGLASMYMDSETGLHIPNTNRTGFTGTVRFASRNQLRLMAHSRRDDMAAVAYILVWMLSGTLPWSGLYKKDMSDEDYRTVVLNKKTEFNTFVQQQLRAKWSPRQVMAYLGLSEEPSKTLFRLVEAVDDLGFGERPSYTRWCGWFKEAVDRLVYQAHQQAVDEIDIFADSVL